jgi:hypothetical protein
VEEDEETADDRTVCEEALDAPPASPAKLPFPINETSSVCREEWEMFLRKTLRELESGPAASSLDVADVSALLVPLRAREVDCVVVAGVARVFMLALLRNPYDGKFLNTWTLDWLIVNSLYPPILDILSFQL